MTIEEQERDLMEALQLRVLDPETAAMVACRDLILDMHDVVHLARGKPLALAAGHQRLREIQLRFGSEAVEEMQPGIFEAVSEAVADRLAVEAVVPWLRDQGLLQE
jgi:hypothetical protein